MLYVQRPKKGHGNLYLKLATVFFSRRPTNGFVIVGSCSIRVSDLCPQHQQMPSIERMFTYLFKNGPFPASFLCVFVFSTVNSLTVRYNFCRWLDSNRGRMLSEATELPTEPRPLSQSPFLCKGKSSCLIRLDRTKQVNQIFM